MKDKITIMATATPALTSSTAPLDPPAESPPVPSLSPLPGLTTLLASMTQQQLHICEEKKKQYGFDSSTGRPTEQSNSRYVWTSTLLPNNSYSS